MDPPPHSDSVSSFLVVDHNMIETDDQLIEITSTDPCQSPDRTCTRMRISDLLVTPPEQHNPGLGEEVGGSANLPSPPFSSGMKPREKSKRLGEGFGMWSPTLSNMLSGNYLDGGRGGRSKLRTPRTLTRLMQQHRDSERHRHRGLNATIKEISRKIPGYEDASNETKIVKLQRIINYICHVEQHIMCLCEEQGLDLEYKNLFLLPHLPKVKDLRKTVSRNSPGGRAVASTVGPRTTYKSSRVSSGRSVTYRSRRRRVKLSSPRVDTRKDRVMSSPTCAPPHNNTDLKDVTWPTKEGVPTLPEGVADDSVAMETGTSGCSEDAMTVAPSSESLPNVLHVTLLKKPENCAVNWLVYASSVNMTDIVEYKTRGACEGQEEGEQGARDIHCLPSNILKIEAKAAVAKAKNEAYKEWYDKMGTEEEETLSESVDITSDVATFHSYAKTPPAPVALTDLVNRESKERGCPPEQCVSRLSMPQQTATCSGATSHPTATLRPPLHSLSNVADSSQGGASVQWQDYPVPPGGQESVLQGNPLLPPTGQKRRQDETVSFQTGSVLHVSTSRDEAENVEPSGGSAGRSGRIDHRKTSWMNGFMMYSRLHRKLYIEENPGVHTSHISKLMGHDWRQLNPMQQQPYRDKAKLYIKQYLSPNLLTS